MMSDRLRGVRILFVLPSLGLGGAERQAFLLARHLLQRERADVRLLGTTRFSTMTGQCDANGLPYEFFDLQRGYLGRIGHVAEVAQFVAVLRRLRVQILLPYCMFQNILCGLTWRAGGARVCIWNQRDEGRSRLARWVERLAIAQIPRFISNSHHGAQFLTDALQVPPNRVHVIHNGIEIPPARLNGANWRGQLGVPSDAFVACMVANLHRRKDHKTLIAAWRLVVDRLEPTGHAPHLLLAGQAVDTHDQLVEQVHRLGLEGLVQFLGEVRDVTSLLASVDLAVFSSFAEGVPNAVLEAMAMGRAVVATDYPGIREAVGPAGAPWLARARDADDLANKIVTAALDPALRDRLGSQGRCRVVNHFSVEKMAAAMTDVILEEWEERSR
jgi:glycosyltransferase involved in cell wall biosynthesis